MNYSRYFSLCRKRYSSPLQLREDTREDFSSIILATLNFLRYRSFDQKHFEQRFDARDRKTQMERLLFLICKLAISNSHT